MSEPLETTMGTEASSRIEWLELFFDLVAVAAVAVLTDGLGEDVSWGGSALFALLYTGIWFGWVSVVLYTNVAGSRTRTRTVLIAMFLVAVMAASAPIHFRGSGERVRVRLPRAAPDHGAVDGRDVGRNPMEVLAVGPRAHVGPSRARSYQSPSRRRAARCRTV